MIARSRALLSEELSVGSGFCLKVNNFSCASVKHMSLSSRKVAISSMSFSSSSDF